MKKLLLSAAVAAATFAAAQTGNVGINTTTPPTTLAVVGTTTDGSKAEGFMAPQMTGDAVQKMTANLTAAQHGNIVYVTTPVTTPDTPTANMTFPGYYRFNDDSTSGTEVKSWVRLEPSGLEKVVSKSNLAGTYFYKEKYNYGWKLISPGVETVDTPGAYSIDMSIKNPNTGMSAYVSGYGYTASIDKYGNLSYTPAGGADYDYFAFYNGPTIFKGIRGASGDYSFAAGWDCNATGVASTALGVGSIAGNTGALAWGNGTFALGSGSLAMGRQSMALGDYSSAIGSNSSALALNSIAIGGNVTLAGAINIGSGNTALVGIGEPEPTQELDVNGDIRVRGNTSTGYTFTGAGGTCANPGTITYQNDTFYGCKTTGWVQLNN